MEADQRSRTRVCVVVPAHWEALMGGAEYQAKLVVEHLAQSGAYDIYYLARFTDARCVPNDHRILTIGGIPGLRRFGYFFDSLALLAALKKIKPDVIYQRVGCAYTGVCSFYAERARCRMIWHIASDADVTPRGPLENLSKPHKLIEKKILEYGIRHSTDIIAQTNHQKTLLEATYGRSPTMIVRNFHPLPQEAGTKDPRVQVLWIANFKPHKRPEVFIQLARDLASRDSVDFLMVGAPAMNRARQEAIDEGVSKASNLQYLGPVTQERVNELLARSHIVVNTSDYEGFSNTFVQAWMRNVAVVSLRVNPDGAFDHERLGICAGGSYTVLVESLARLIDDEALRASIVRRARSEAIKEHSPRNLDAILAAIESTAAAVDARVR